MIASARLATAAGRLFAGLTCMLLCVSALGTGAKAAPQSAGPGLEVVGMLPEPKDDVLNKWIVSLDEKNRRLYYLWRVGPRFYLREYDLRPEMPRFMREAFVGTFDELILNSASPYNLLIDHKRDRMYILSPSHGGSLIRIVDLKKFDVIGTWELTTDLPGFIGSGMTYSPKDDRIYVIGSIFGDGRADGMTNNFVVKASTPTAVVAIDAKSRVDFPTAEFARPDLSWVRVVPECQQVLNTLGVGSLIARGASQDALYFACARPDPWPGESGLVRIWIDPNADMAQAQNFTVDFFPISGSYGDVAGGRIGLVGTAVFDAASNRFFMHSVSKATPGTWVFDGDLSAWVGFIAAPNNAGEYIGLDPSTGHFFIGSDEVDRDSGYALVSDARGTPVPQGDLYEHMSFRSFIVVDPPTHRLFVQTDPKDIGLKGDETGYVVLRDNTPETHPPSPPDYDALTMDIPEGPKTITSYSGSVNGFGLRAVLVGGYGGALSVAGDDVRVGEVRPGDRGLTTARVPSVDLRSVGASATAQAYMPDSNTAAELQDGADQEWPWEPASCLDGNGEEVTIDRSANGGEAHVTCDLAKESARASAWAKAFSAGGFEVGSAFFDSIIQRVPDKGVVTKAVAVAENVSLTTPGGGFAIDRIETTAETVAAGRPKTNDAHWERVLSGIVLRDGQGEILQRVGECSSTAKQDDCAPLIQQINNLLRTRVHIDLPRPEIVKTPKGAFAGVQQTDADFYQNRTINNQGATFTGESASRAVPGLQITILNDTRQKSRLLIQLAAMQAGSIYTISQAPPPPRIPPAEPAPPAEAPESASGGVSTPPDLGGDLDLGGGAIAAPVDPAPIPVVQAVLDTITAFIPRSPQEVVLFTAFWSIFGGAGWTVYRRRSLLSILQGAGR